MWVTAFETEDLELLNRIINGEDYVPDYKVLSDRILIYSNFKGEAEKEKAYYDGYLEYLDRPFQSWIYFEEDYDESIEDLYNDNGVKESEFY